MLLHNNHHRDNKHTTASEKKREKNFYVIALSLYPCTQGKAAEAAASKHGGRIFSICAD